MESLASDGMQCFSVRVDVQFPPGADVSALASHNNLISNLSQVCTGCSCAL